MKKYRFFHPLFMAFFSKSLYQDVGRNWKGVCFLYLLILAAVSIVSPIIQIKGFLNTKFPEIINPIIEQIPAITVSKGHVSIDQDEPYYIKAFDSEQPLVIIDTTGKITSLPDDKTVLLITKTKIITKEQEFDLPKEKDLIVDQYKVQEWIDIFTKWFLIAIIPIMFITIYIFYIIGDLILAAIGMLFTKILKVKLDYPALMRLAIIAITPAVLVNVLFELKGINIPFLILLVIDLGYLFYAVKANTVNEQP